jgi:CRP-like cAMP-binding protein
MLTMNEIKADDTRHILSDIELLRGLSPSQLDWVARRSHRRVFNAGKDIFTIEQPAEAVYVILHGTVKIHIEQASGQDVVLSILGSGDTLGEMSLIDSVGRSASAVTLEDTLMLWMDRSTFQTLLDEYPPVARNLVRILSARVRLSDQLIQAFATLDVYGRVARQLLAFAEKYGLERSGTEIRIPITLTQADIADLVGASRKRVNQVMVAFKTQNLIEVDDTGHVTVVDKVGLAQFCK